MKTLLMPDAMHNNDDPTVRLIETDAGLKEIAPLLMKEKIIGVDLEADSMFHFTEKVCLIQITASKACYLIDPLSLQSLAPLAPMFADKNIKKVFHGADYDIRSLYRDFEIEVNNLFDSELACRFLGRKTTGLNAVVKHRFGVELDKKYQKKDWSRRPLSEGMLTYAARDTTYLIPIYEWLSEELEKAGRTAWVEEECQLLSQVRAEDNNGAPLFLKFKGAGRLSRRRLAVLEAILQMRQAVAAKKDRPPFKVLGNKTILDIVQDKPVNKTQLQRSKALSAKQMAMCGSPLIAAISRALSLPDKELPTYPRPKRPSIPPQRAARLECLKQWRDKVAADLYVDPGVIFPKSLMVAVADKKPAGRKALNEIEGLREWQKNEFGKQLVSVLKEVP